MKSKKIINIKTFPQLVYSKLNRPKFLFHELEPLNKNKNNGKLKYIMRKFLNNKLFLFLNLVHNFLEESEIKQYLRSTPPN